MKVLKRNQWVKNQDSNLHILRSNKSRKNSNYLIFYFFIYNNELLRVEIFSYLSINRIQYVALL